MSDFGQLLGGFRVFKATTYAQHKDAVGHIIRQGLRPKTMFITCSDLKVSPDTIFSSNPGDFFVFRNIASLVPPYNSEGENGVIAAIEYAVSNLKVDNIVVLGHSGCHSIRSLMEDEKVDSHMRQWLSIAEEAKDVINRDLAKKDMDERIDACEHESILVSLKNLLTYPFIESRIADNSLKLYGWHFDIQSGNLLGFNPETKFFESIG